MSATIKEPSTQLTGADLPDKMPTLLVSEIYGPVCQGEGALIGRPTIFVRLAGCDYRCSWCDSLYAVDAKLYRKEWRKWQVDEIVATVRRLLGNNERGGHVTLSGGNPALQDCGELIERLHELKIEVGIETQGTVNPYWLNMLDHVTLSPKPPSSGNVTLLDDPALNRIIASRHVSDPRWLSLKVVVFDDADYEYARQVHKQWRRVPMFVQVGTGTGYDTRDDLCDSLIRLQDRVCADPEMRDVAVLPQLHAILKGHARGI